MNYKNPYLIVALAIITLVVIFGILKLTTDKIAIEPSPSPTVGTEGLTIYGVRPNETIATPLKITGQVSGNGWGGFEGQVGTVQLLDASGKEITLGILNAPEWMQATVDFETTLHFVSEVEQTGQLIFRNENPAGDPARDRTFTIPVKLPKMETQKVLVYYHKPGDECENVSPVERTIVKTVAPARAALEELLRGPAFKENSLYSTSINSGVTINKLEISDEVTYVDFSKQLAIGVAGSCRVMAIEAQIEKTLLQFPTVKAVLIAVDGQMNALQP